MMENVVLHGPNGKRVPLAALCTIYEGAPDGGGSRVVSLAASRRSSPSTQSRNFKLLSALDGNPAIEHCVSSSYFNTVFLLLKNYLFLFSMILTLLTQAARCEHSKGAIVYR